MQIFILDKQIEENVKAYADKHVVKILTEICQIMCTVYKNSVSYPNLPEFLYKPTHEHHPCVLWCGKSMENFCYCLRLAEALYYEYQYRYQRPDKHARAKAIIDYLKHYFITIKFEEYDLTPFAQAMPEEYCCEDAVEAYRKYYIKEKNHLFQWKNREVPKWIEHQKCV